MIFCKECDGSSYSYFDGKYYCSECNIQIADYHEVEVDPVYAPLGGSQKYSQASQFKDIATKFDVGIPWTYPEAFAIIITKQCDAFASLSNIINYKIVVSNLYKLYLRNLGIAFSDKPSIGPNPRPRDFFKNVKACNIKKLKQALSETTDTSFTQPISHNSDNEDETDYKPTSIEFDQELRLDTKPSDYSFTKVTLETSQTTSELHTNIYDLFNHQFSAILDKYDHTNKIPKSEIVEEDEEVISSPLPYNDKIGNLEPPATIKLTKSPPRPQQSTSDDTVRVTRSKTRANICLPKKVKSNRVNLNDLGSLLHPGLDHAEVTKYLASQYGPKKESINRGTGTAKYQRNSRKRKITRGSRFYIGNKDLTRKFFNKSLNIYRGGTLRTGYLTMLSTLGFSYIGIMLCSSVHKPHLLSDILRLISQKRFPYYVNNFSTLLPDTFKFFNFDTCVFNTRTVLTARAVRFQAGKIINELIISTNKNTNRDENVKNLFLFEPSSSPSLRSSINIKMFELEYVRSLTLNGLCQRLNVPAAIKLILQSLFDSFKTLINRGIFEDGNGEFDDYIGNIDTSDNSRLFNHHRLPCPLFFLDDPPFSRFRDHLYAKNWEGRAWAFLIVAFKVYQFMELNSEHVIQQPKPSNVSKNKFSHESHISQNRHFTTWFNIWVCNQSLVYGESFNKIYDTNHNKFSNYSMKIGNSHTIEKHIPALEDILLKYDEESNDNDTSPNINLPSTSNIQDYSAKLNDINAGDLHPYKNNDISSADHTNNPSHLDLLYKPNVVKARPFRSQVDVCIKTSALMAYRKQLRNLTDEPHIKRLSSSRSEKQALWTQKLAKIVEELKKTHIQTPSNNNFQNIGRSSSADPLPLDPVSLPKNKRLEDGAMPQNQVIHPDNFNFRYKTCLDQLVVDSPSIRQKGYQVTTETSSKNIHLNEKMLKLLFVSISAGLKRYLEKTALLNKALFYSFPSFDQDPDIGKVNKSTYYLTKDGKRIKSEFFAENDNYYNFDFPKKFVNYSTVDRNFKRDFKIFTTSYRNRRSQFSQSQTSESVLEHVTNRLIELACDLSYQNSEEIMFELCLLEHEIMNYKIF